MPRIGAGISSEIAVRGQCAEPHGSEGSEAPRGASVVGSEPPLRESVGLFGEGESERGR